MNLQIEDGYIILDGVRYEDPNAKKKVLSATDTSGPMTATPKMHEGKDYYATLSEIERERACNQTLINSLEMQLEQERNTSHFLREELREGYKLQSEKDNLILELKNHSELQAIQEKERSEIVTKLEKDSQELRRIADNRASYMKDREAAVNKLRAELQETQTLLKESEERIGNKEAVIIALREKLDELRTGDIPWPNAIVDNLAASVETALRALSPRGLEDFCNLSERAKGIRLDAIGTSLRYYKDWKEQGDQGQKKATPEAPTTMVFENMKDGSYQAEIIGEPGTIGKGLSLQEAFHDTMSIRENAKNRASYGVGGEVPPLEMLQSKLNELQAENHLFRKMVGDGGFKTAGELGDSIAHQMQVMAEQQKTIAELKQDNTRYSHAILSLEDAGAKLYEQLNNARYRLNSYLQHLPEGATSKMESDKALFSEAFEAWDRIQHQPTGSDVVRLPKAEDLGEHSLASTKEVLDVLTERWEQIKKHGFTKNFVVKNAPYYENHQLQLLAIYALTKDFNYWPSNYQMAFKVKLDNKTHYQRIVVACAVLLSELERLNMPEYESQRNAIN